MTFQLKTLRGLLPTFVGASRHPPFSAAANALQVPLSDRHLRLLVDEEEVGDNVLGSQPGLNSGDRGRGSPPRPHVSCVPKTLQPVAEQAAFEAWFTCHG